MATGSTDDLDGTRQPGSRARYRTIAHGAHVVVVPACCPNGLHVLTGTGYRVYETGHTLRVSCQQCTQLGRPDHSWTFATNGQRAASAEFDDEPYAELLKDLARR
ncbi:hypothetical protein ACIA8G_21575 [Lentzea sp. NPDC051213]|uniref:hypothetical protein n=1 Tax=Lentzea sp. NPDC051213 TaxID=3364126 RepID=UPI0037BBD9C8